ncbi:MAG: hypothetical protein SOI64_07895 [Bifidobacterium mongoliense]
MADQPRSRGPSASMRPPRPPIELTPLLACDGTTDMAILWHIAREAPELRRWLIANPRADATLLEYVAQAGGPGVTEGLEVLLTSIDPAGTDAAHGATGKVHAEAPR